MVGSRERVYQKCDDCVNACGGCSFTESDEAGNIMLQPVPGWIAEKVPWKPYSSSETKEQFTYRVIACPQYEQDRPKSKVKRKYRWNYTGPILAVNIYTKEETVFESMEQVEKAGFLPSAVNWIILEGKNFHKGHRFIGIRFDRSSPCFKCNEITRKTCMSRKGTCGEYERWKVENKIDNTEIGKSNLNTLN